MFTKKFAKAAAERAVKTFAQSLAALLAAGGTGVLQVDWTQDLSIAGLAGVVSLLTSVASGAITGSGPSLTTEHVS